MAVGFELWNDERNYNSFQSLGRNVIEMDAHGLALRLEEVFCVICLNQSLFYFLFHMNEDI